METKSCPFCAETIKAEAIICRFCNRQVAIPDVATAQAIEQLNQTIIVPSQSADRVTDDKDPMETQGIPSVRTPATFNENAEPTTYLAISPQVFPAEPQKQTAPVSSTLNLRPFTPVGTDDDEVAPRPSPLGKLAMLAYLRDVAIQWVITIVMGAIVGTLVGPRSNNPDDPYLLQALTLGSLIALPAGFAISGSLAVRDGFDKWKHLAIVATLTWVTCVANIFFGFTNLSDWLLSLPFLYVMMGVGGAISKWFPIRKNIPNSTIQNIPKPIVWLKKIFPWVVGLLAVVGILFLITLGKVGWWWLTKPKSPEAKPSVTQATAIQSTEAITSEVANSTDSLSYIDQEMLEADEILGKMPLYQTIKKVDPKQYDHMRSLMRKGLEEGKTQGEMEDAIRQSINAFVQKQLTHASPTSIKRFLQYRLDIYKHIAANAPESLYAFIAIGKVDPAMNGYMLKSQEAWSKIFYNPPSNKLIRQNKKLIKRRLATIGRNLTMQDLRAFQHPVKTKKDELAYGIALIHFYREGLKLPETEVVQVFREMGEVPKDDRVK